MEINYGKQFIDQKDIKEVSKSLQKKFITTGEYVKKFERAITQKFKCKFASSCSNATAGIHLAYLAINLKKDDVVLMPSINFISSYRMAKLMGAKVYLVDVDSKTGQMNKKSILKCIKINKLKKIKVLVSMYLGGYVYNNIEFYKLKKKYGFYLIEDACHAIGSRYIYNNKKYYIGSCKHSDICIFSFHPVKSITTGEGGAILTNNRKISKNVTTFRNHGIVKKKNYWDYDIKELGFNYRLSDINCALGFSQLKKINKFKKKRKEIFRLYESGLSKYKFLIFPNVSHNDNLYHLFLIGFDFKYFKSNKDQLIKFLNSKNIFPQFHYKPIFKFSFYKKKNNNKFPGALKYYENFISLPIFFRFSIRQQIYVIDKIKSFIKKYKK